MSESRLVDDLHRARAAVTEAELIDPPAERFVAAHLAALRIAAIVLSLRARPVVSAHRSRPRNAWRLVAEVAPEFAEWAAFFAATEGKRDAVRAGASAIVAVREADDLVRDAQAFLALVEAAVARAAGSRRRGETG